MAPLEVMLPVGHPQHACIAPHHVGATLRESVASFLFWLECSQPVVTPLVENCFAHPHTQHGEDALLASPNACPSQSTNYHSHVGPTLTHTAMTTSHSQGVLPGGWAEGNHACKDE